MKNTIVVTAIIAVMQPGTETQSSKGVKQPLGSCTSNNIKVILDSGSDGDLYFLGKGKHKLFLCLARQVPKSCHRSNESFHENVKGKLKVNFFEYSASREYSIEPEIV